MRQFISICKLLIVLPLLMAGCREEYSPKPYGYYRIDFPEKAYHRLAEKYPYQFEMGNDATVEQDTTAEAEPHWINLAYPQYNAKIHLSYKKITTDTSLAYFQQDCHRLAYTHTIKAESINENFYKQDSSRVFGLVYFIEGNAASSAQFYVTDSTRHFLRGALYFNEHPNKDSLAPVIDYLRRDIVTLIETIQFK